MFKFLKEYFPYYKNYKKEIFLAFIGMILVSGASAATAYLVKPLLDKIFIEKNEQLLYIIPLFIILVYFLKGVGLIIQQYYIAYIGEDIVRKIRDKFLTHMLTLDLNFFKNTHSGELVSRIINDINRIQAAISNNMASLVQNVLMALFLMGVVIYQNAHLAFFALIILPLLIYPVSIITKKLKKLSKKSQSKTADINKHLSEIFKNIETIKAYNAKEYEQKNFYENNLNFFKINMKAKRTQIILTPILETFSATIAAIVIIVGGKEVIEGSMSVGEFFSFMTALFMMTEPIKKVTQNFSKMQDAIAVNERLKEILHLKPQISSGSKPLKEIKNIEFKDVSLYYGDKKALDLINYSIREPKRIGLVGDSGGGKSSFVSLLMRFYDASSGELRINENSIKEYDIFSLREKIAYIPQNVHIFNDTIAKNIAYGKEVDEQKVIQALQKANLYDFVQSLPEGIYTILNEGGSNLSGGQKQRVAIARALYTNPDVLILDEATSALDNKSESIIMQSIKKLEDKIIFIIAHRLKSIEDVDEILFFKDGTIICQGSKEEVLKNCVEFQRLYNA